MPMTTCSVPSSEAREMMPFTPTIMDSAPSRPNRFKLLNFLARNA